MKGVYCFGDSHRHGKTFRDPTSTYEGCTRIEYSFEYTPPIFSLCQKEAQPRGHTGIVQVFTFGIVEYGANENVTTVWHIVHLGVL